MARWDGWVQEGMKKGKMKLRLTYLGHDGQPTIEVLAYGLDVRESFLVLKLEGREATLTDGGVDLHF
jgi:hypothetical protein